MIESKEFNKFNATILNIGNDDVSVVITCFYDHLFISVILQFNFKFLVWWVVFYANQYKYGMISTLCVKWAYCKTLALLIS